MFYTYFSQTKLNMCCLQEYSAIIRFQFLYHKHATRCPYFKTQSSTYDNEQELCFGGTQSLPKASFENILKLKPCKECKFCLCKKDFGECINCADKPEFDGTGQRKERCINRECEVIAEYKLNKARQQSKKRYAQMSREEKTQ